MIAIRILKIDSEIAEIIEVKCGTCNTNIFFLQNVIFYMTGANIDFNYFSSVISKLIFKILVAITEQISRAVE